MLRLLRFGRDQISRHRRNRSIPICEECVEWLLNIEQGNWFKVIDVRFGLLWIWWKALYLGMWTNWLGSNRIQIYMKEFKLRALKTSPHPLDEWYWYVDGSELKCKDERSERILVHLNSVKLGVIVFPKEDQENDILPVLNLKQKVDRKTKQVECMVDYEKTHININVKERSRPTVLRVWRKGLRFC